MTANSLPTEFGISALGFAIPSLALPLSELAAIHSVDAAQYTDNLGCQYMALCAPDENALTLATTAAQRALAGQDFDIGLVIVATESASDMSRPLSASLMHALGLSGQIRSYEVKHACYGGTAAVRQALEWQLSGNAKGKAALVVCTDVAMYAPGHSGEPTQGAGACAIVIDKPTIAVINPTSYYWSESNYDFWRPVGDAYPSVNGRLSLVCYIKAVLACFGQLAPQAQLGGYLAGFKYINFHVPFPKMVQKAVKKLADHCGFDSATCNHLYTSKIFPTMEWNQQIGNSYTASLWFAVANTLIRLQPYEQFAAFSYGSGCGAELLTLQCKANQANSSWVELLQQDFAQRTIINRQQYMEIRNKT